MYISMYISGNNIEWESKKFNCRVPILVRHRL